MRRVKVNPKTQCWEWTASLFHNGYGKFSLEGHPKKAHRVSYAHFNGPIPEGLLVCHSCDNRPCINPTHLWLGTAGDNARDREAKGRGRFAKPTPAKPLCLEAV